MSIRRLSFSIVLGALLVLAGTVPAHAAVTYKVKRGDSLYKIAVKFGTTVRKLQISNKLGWRTMIYPGQKLVISKTANSAQPQVSRGATTRGVIPYRAEEVNLLARLITAEAGGESYKAQVAVGAVIVNRVQSPLFPNTISSVIYQVEDGHYQFTPVLNGWINRPATATSLQAAKEALAGSDPTKGAIWFFVTGTPNRFLNARPVAAYIDNITFAY